MSISWWRWCVVTLRELLGAATPALPAIQNALSAAFGATVAAGDIDGDGKDEIIAGTTVTDSSVTIIRADGTKSLFKAFDKYGVNVAAADLDGDGAAEIIAAQGEPTWQIRQAHRRHGR